MAEAPHNISYMNYADSESDFKRKADPKKDIRMSDDEEENEHEGEGKFPGKPNDYFIKELLSERVQMDGKYPHADRLLQQELAHAKQNGKLPHKDIRYVDLYREKPIKVVVKVTVPVKEHPKFNFVGKLLGPKGNSLRRLQEETLCKMAVMGRGSMKDRGREESLRQSLDPKYGHLNDELHVEISALAPPAEAHARVAYALAEVRKYLIPDSNDEIRQEQFRELVADGVLPPVEEDDYYSRPSHNPPPPPPTQSSSSSGYSKRGPPPNPRSRSPSRAMAPKQKVLSLLDRARTAMDDRYASNYNESVDYDMPPYDRGYHHEAEQHPNPRNRSRPVASQPPPPPMEYRRDYYRDRSPEYVKSEHHSHHHPHHHGHGRRASPPPLPSTSWRSGGSAYASSSRSHPAAEPEDHYARHLPHHRGGYHPGAASGTSDRSYRDGPYMRVRPQK